MGIFSKGDVVGGDKAGGDIVRGDKVSGNKGDTITAQNSVGVGKGFQMQDVEVSQNITQTNEGFDMPALAQELEKLRIALLREASEPEEIVMASEVAHAEKAAKEGDESKTLEHLKKAGDWVLDIAAKIGVPLAIEAMKRTMMP
ncbi:MAG: hypothetical protein WBD27_03620 [Pyrinomonadaceae bacterium]